MKKVSLAISAVIVFGLSLQRASAQRTLKVPGQYPTIQSAINSAWTSGDTVLVAPGTYRENINFFGKEVKVTSSHGPTATIIDGNQSGSVVTFYSSETADSVLEGFTIMGGTGTSHPNYGNAGGGIFVLNASPTVRDCKIVGNTACSGAGIFVQQGLPRIFSNWFSGNMAVNQDSTTGRGGALYLNNYANTNDMVVDGNSFVGNRAVEAAGVYISGRATVANNLFAGNFAEQFAAGIYLYIYATVPILNCVFTGNKVTSLNQTSVIHAYDPYKSAVSVTNSIVWNNSGSPQISNGIPVTYSDIEGGYSGLGNISKDPMFVDEQAGDFHLRHDSPCRDAGTKVVSGLPATDFEGDPRAAGTSVDMGMDEFYPHVYGMGDSSPGGTLRIRMIGNPSDPALWAVSFNPSVLSPPLSIPGLAGQFHLMFPIVFVPVGNFPSKGVLTFPVKFPTNFPVPADYPMQVLSGLYLSNLHVVNVR